jgi:hypothetical protein
VTLVVFQCLQQPVVEATDFHYCQKRFPILEELAFQPLKELLNLLRLRRDLSGLHHIALFIPQGNRELAGMLIDSKVQHRRGSPAKGRGSNPPGLVQPIRARSPVGMATSAMPKWRFLRFSVRADAVRISFDLCAAMCGRHEPDAPRSTHRGEASSYASFQHMLCFA